MRKPCLHVELEVPRFGEFARQLGCVRSRDVLDCLELQQQHGERMGQIMVRRGLLTPAQVAEVLRNQAQWAARMRRHDLSPLEFPLPTPFSLCLPCFNEAEVIGEVLSGALAVLPEFLDEFEIVVVDDGSADATATLVERYAEQDGRIRLVRHDRNRGYGAAVSTALRAARGAWICFTDGDGQFNLLDLPQLLVIAQQADVVLGYRYQRADNMLRRFNAQSWKTLVDCLLGVCVRDLDCAFKLFPRWVVESLELTAEGACISAEIVAQCVRGGVTVGEIPVNHFARSAGRATGANLRVITKAFCELPALWRYRRLRPGQFRRPTAADRPDRATLPWQEPIVNGACSPLAVFAAEPAQNGTR